MRDDLTAIALVLDKSGSMHLIRQDTIGAVNQFIEDQRDVDGDALFWLTMFNTNLYHVHEGEPLDQVPLLNGGIYRPGGATALLDAVGTTIDNLGARLAAMDEADRPGKVVFVIQTDGLENSSREYTQEQVRAKIREQSDEWNWQFLFLGADQDAWNAAAGIGIQRGQSISYGKQQQGAAYSMTSDTVASFRRGTSAGTAFDDTDIRTDSDDDGGS